MPLHKNNKEIRDLWLKGLTGSQIAKELGVTRNSVIGKLHRMRHAGLLAGRTLDERMQAVSMMKQKTGPKPPKQVPPVIEREPQVLKPKPEPEPKSLFVCEEAPLPVEAFKKPVKFDKLTPQSCRFILNSGDPKDFLFCNKPKKGKSYCEDHQKLCYYPVPKKEIANVKE